MHVRELKSSFSPSSAVIPPEQKARKTRAGGTAGAGLRRRLPGHRPARSPPHLSRRGPARLHPPAGASRAKSATRHGPPRLGQTRGVVGGSRRRRKRQERGRPAGRGTAAGSKALGRRTRSGDTCVPGRHSVPFRPSRHPSAPGSGRGAQRQPRGAGSGARGRARERGCGPRLTGRRPGSEQSRAAPLPGRERRAAPRAARPGDARAPGTPARAGSGSAGPHPARGQRPFGTMGPSPASGRGDTKAEPRGRRARRPESQGGGGRGPGRGRGWQRARQPAGRSAAVQGAAPAQRAAGARGERGRAVAPTPGERAAHKGERDPQLQRQERGRRWAHPPSRALGAARPSTHP